MIIIEADSGLPLDQSFDQLSKTHILLDQHGTVVTADTATVFAFDRSLFQVGDLNSSASSSHLVALSVVSPTSSYGESSEVEDQERALNIRLAHKSSILNLKHHSDNLIEFTDRASIQHQELLQQAFRLTQAQAEDIRLISAFKLQVPQITDRYNDLNNDKFQKAQKYAAQIADKCEAEVDVLEAATDRSYMASRKLFLSAILRVSYLQTEIARQRQKLKVLYGQLKEVKLDYTLHRTVPSYLLHIAEEQRNQILDTLDQRLYDQELYRRKAFDKECGPYLQSYKPKHTLEEALAIIKDTSLYNWFTIEVASQLTIELVQQEVLTSRSTQTSPQGHFEAPLIQRRTTPQVEVSLPFVQREIRQRSVSDASVLDRLRKYYKN